MRILYHSMNFSEVFQPDHQSNVDPYKEKDQWDKVRCRWKRHSVANGQSDL